MNEPEPEKKDDNHRSNNSVLKLYYCKCMCFRFQEIRIHQPTPSPHFFQLIFTDFDFLLQVEYRFISYMCKYMRLRPTLFSYTLRDNLLHCKLVSSFTVLVNNKKRIQPRYIFITFCNDIKFCVHLTKIYYNTQCNHYL